MYIHAIPKRDLFGQIRSTVWIAVDSNIYIYCKEKNETVSQLYQRQ